MCQDLFDLTNKEDNTASEGAEIFSENSIQTADSFRAKHIMSERADYLDISSSHVVSHFRTLHRSLLAPHTNAVDMPPRSDSNEQLYSLSFDTDTDTETSSSPPTMMDVELDTKNHITPDDDITANYQNILPANLLEGQSEFCLVGC